MTMADNLKFSKHKEVRGIGYDRYDNFDAIEVPFTDAIPSDYDGVMGVPITFLDKYNPDQFEIIANGDDRDEMEALGVPAARTRIRRQRWTTQGRRYQAPRRLPTSASSSATAARPKRKKK